MTLDVHHFAERVFSLALQRSRDMFIDGEQPIPADELSSANLLYDDQERALESVDPRVVVRRVANIGLEPIAADIAVHDHINEQLESLLPDERPYLVGEEADEDAWIRMDRAPRGSLIVVLDAIDGSKPYENLAFGHGITLLVYRRRQTDHFEGAAVCGSSGVCISLTSGRHEVLIGPVGDNSHAPLILDDDIMSSHNPAVAIVAAVPDDRRDRQARTLLRTFTNDKMTVYNLGGAPASVGLMAGKLGGIVCLKRQTIWDAAYLPILIELGVPVFQLDGRRVHNDDVARWFGVITHKKAGLTPVPPFVAARTDDYATEILFRVNKAAQPR